MQDVYVCQLNSCTIKTDPSRSNIYRLTNKEVLFNDLSKQGWGHIRDNAKHMTNEVNDKSAEEVFEMEAHKDGMKIVILGPYRASSTFTFRFILQQTKYCTFWVSG